MPSLPVVYRLRLSTLPRRQIDEISYQVLPVNSRNSTDGYVNFTWAVMPKVYGQGEEAWSLTCEKIRQKLTDAGMNRDSFKNRPQACAEDHER
jgi:hypothetical protein